GRTEGRTEEAARAVLTVLRVRGLRVPDAVRERILTERDPERLERWLEKAGGATSVGGLLGGPHRAGRPRAPQPGRADCCSAMRLRSQGYRYLALDLKPPCMSRR